MGRRETPPWDTKKAHAQEQAFERAMAEKRADGLLHIATDIALTLSDVVIQTPGESPELVAVFDNTETDVTALSLYQLRDSPYGGWIASRTYVQDETPQTQRQAFEAYDDALDWLQTLTPYGSVPHRTVSGRHQDARRHGYGPWSGSPRELRRGTSPDIYACCICRREIDPAETPSDEADRQRVTIPRLSSHPHLDPRDEPSRRTCPDVECERLAALPAVVDAQQNKQFKREHEDAADGIPGEKPAADTQPTVKDVSPDEEAIQQKLDALETDAQSRDVSDAERTLRQVLIEQAHSQKVITQTGEYHAAEWSDVIAEGVDRTEMPPGRVEELLETILMQGNAYEPVEDFLAPI